MGLPTLGTMVRDSSVECECQRKSIYSPAIAIDNLAIDRHSCIAPQGIRNKYDAFYMPIQ